VSPFAGSTVFRVGDLSVGVVGLLSPSLCPKELTASSPASAAREQLALMGTVDLLVALAHQPPEEDVELARQVPFDLLIAAHGGVPVVASQIEGRTLRVRNGNSARFIGRVDLELGKPGASGAFSDGNALLRTWLATGDWQKTRGPFVGVTPGDARRFAAALIPLEEELPLDAEVAGRIATYRAQADARERARLATGGAAAASVDNSAYAGDMRCATCHAQAYEAWKGSLHASAYETLVRVGHALDTNCVGCHTTGYGRRGGFEHPAQVGFLKEVQCEVCHGPGRTHVVNPKGARLTVPAGEQTCRGCQSSERSPAFNYASYLARIAHH